MIRSVTPCVITRRLTMKFEVRVYSEDGQSRGATVLDSSVDTDNGKPVNSIEKARAYAERCLVGKGCYAFVDPV